jgi:hypothetical protein
MHACIMWVMARVIPAENMVAGECLHFSSNMGCVGFCLATCMHLLCLDHIGDVKLTSFHQEPLHLAQVVRIKLNQKPRKTKNKVALCCTFASFHSVPAGLRRGPRVDSWLVQGFFMTFTPPRDALGQWHWLFFCPFFRPFFCPSSFFLSHLLLLALSSRRPWSSGRRAQVPDTYEASLVACESCAINRELWS